MTPVGFTQDETYLAITTPAGKDALLVDRIEGEEGLSTPFRFGLELRSENAELDFSQLVGQGATVAIRATNATRYVHGIVTRFVQAGTGERFTTYFAELRPWFWLLTLSSDNRIFQQKSVVDIVTAVFDGLGFSDYKDATTGTYPAREYTVQYGETAFAFVSRLLEEEGIHYYFDHADGVHTLVLADDAGAHQPCEGPASVYFNTSESARERDDVITGCRLEAQITTNAYTLRDFAFETPSTDLAGTMTGDASTRKRYDYPGGFAANDRGAALARVRLEACEVPARVLQGTSGVRTFTPGHTFTMTDHDRSDLNATYLLRHVVHHATPDHYSNAFEALPSSVPFRPPVVTPRPRMAGVQSATVVGKSGEEIWTDQYGRVKVQFHWDQLGTNDENSSCWLRVAQGWAGTAWGMRFTPRIGHEVLVTFLDGDPDRPLVTGSVYNAQNVTPYALPDTQTQSVIKSNTSPGGGGSNEIRFEDKKDSEEVYVHAQKDMNVLVENDRTTTITHADTLTVSKANRTVTVSEGDDSHTVSKGKRMVAVSAGDESHTVGGKRSLDVTGDETHTNAAAFTHEVKGDYVLKVTGNLTIESQGAISIKSGTSFANEAGTALSNKAGTDLSNEATSALSNKGLTVSNEASTSLTNKGASVTNDASGELNNKAGGVQNVEASGILVLKGSLVKIN
jgi:type VI secretion system secreted protein VgrG